MSWTRNRRAPVRFFSLQNIPTFTSIIRRGRCCRIITPSISLTKSGGAAVWLCAFGCAAPTVGGAALFDLAAGHGAWAYSEAAARVAVGCDPVAAQQVEVTLAPGWNQVANPVFM